MNIRKSIYSLFLLCGTAALLISGCSTIEVGIEPISSPTQIVIPGPTDTTEPGTLEPIKTEAQPTATATGPKPTELISPFPELVTIGYLTPYGSGDFGVLVLDGGELKVEPSPVPFQIFWEYTPLTGRLAYSPEFVHGSDHNNVSVTSLWVYDYESGTAEIWLEDNVIRAGWSPDGELVTAAVYNPTTEQIDLVFVSGPGQVEVIAECASNLFSWSPDGRQLAYVNAVSSVGVAETCAGTYLVSFPDGLSGLDAQVERVSDFGSWELLSGQVSDQPLWALNHDALIYPDHPFWVIPLDGSPAFVPATPQGEDPLELPRSFGALWSDGLNQLAGNVDAGLSAQGGVWVYQLSEDLSSIEDYYRIGDRPPGDNSDISLVYWWNPDESLLVLDGDNFDSSQYLNQSWRAPAIWSLPERQWLDYP